MGLDPDNAPKLTLPTKFTRETVSVALKFHVATLLPAARPTKEIGPDWFVNVPRKPTFVAVVLAATPKRSGLPPATPVRVIELVASPTIWFAKASPAVAVVTRLTAAPVASVRF